VKVGYFTSCNFMTTDGELFDAQTRATERETLPAYASAFWSFARFADSKEARITIGWSMPLGGLEFRSGATTFVTKFGGVEPVQDSGLPFVEESLGIVHHMPSLEEEEWNAHLERLAADYLLFFVHRALFGQCRRMWEHLAGGQMHGEPDVVDNAFIFGPTLPKFRGRICYSHFRRDKTVAVLAPECPIGRLPPQSAGAWKSEPTPAFWHDSSARRWVAAGARSANEGGPRLSSFDLIVPTGDGLSGKLIAGLPRAATLWREKATLVQNLLDRDRELARLAVWQNSEVYLPRGLARAVRAAVLGETLSQATARRKEMRRNASSAERKFYDELGKEIELREEIDGPEGEIAGLRALVFCKAVEVSQAGQKRPAGSKAFRDVKSAADSVPRALAAIKEEVGEYTFSR